MSFSPHPLLSPRLLASFLASLHLRPPRLASTPPRLTVTPPRLTVTPPFLTPEVTLTSHLIEPRNCLGQDYPFIGSLCILEYKHGVQLVARRACLTCVRERAECGRPALFSQRLQSNQNGHGINRLHSSSARPLPIHPSVRSLPLSSKQRRRYV